MRILGPTKWLILAVLVSACTRGGPPAPVFDRVLALLQSDKQPATTAQLRGRIGGDDVILDKRISTNALDSANGGGEDRAAPLAEVRVEQIAPFNDGQNSGVQFGQAPGTQSAVLPNAADGPAVAFHTVARGDTLYNVSKRYGTDVATLAEHNGIRPPYTISLEQRIDLPTVSGGPNPAPVAVAAATPLPAAEPVLAEPVPVLTEPVGPALRSAPDTAPVSKLAAVGGPRSKPRIPAHPVEQAVVSIGAPPARAGGAFAWPVDGRILVGYGPTADGLYNDGLNIAAPMKAPVRAAENGVVAYAGNEIRGFGKLVLIKHDGGLITAYGHNNDLLVRRGDMVRKGQVIARVGASGGVEVPQLHFEIRDGRRAVDPSKLLPERNV